VHKSDKSVHNVILSLPRRCVTCDKPFHGLLVVFTGSLNLRALASLLTFESNERDAIIRTRFYLEKEQWRKITNIVKKHDGEWIPDGKESRWIIPLK
jgi:hypothetical protein